jgi:hypothetical protein
MKTGVDEHSIKHHCFSAATDAHPHQSVFIRVYPWLSLSVFIRVNPWLSLSVFVRVNPWLSFRGYTRGEGAAGISSGRCRRSRALAAVTSTP